MPTRDERLAIFDDVQRQQPDIARTMARMDREVLAGFPLPPADSVRQSGPFTSMTAFYRSAFKQFGECLRYTEITPRSRVLDYGCGFGRISIPLLAYLEPEHGRYVGVDTSAACVGHNAAAFASASHFRFVHANVFSSFYNPEGGPMTGINRLDLGEPFDLACLFSVFTHVLPEDCDDLLAFLADRVRPGGELLCSWFLLNPETCRLIGDRKALYTFATPHGEAWIDNPAVPEGAVAYEENDVLERMAAAGFEVDRLIHGHWRGCEGPTGQDLVVARRR